ncbi:Bifunctional DNA primase/polymerase, N-terminal [Mycobacteroides abscessus subsp. massiliense]|uniref:bifunctional DNA primase/polymerase n=1 Tax=Mycobacteroides abscessus TaxID=36809 RepID=UPI0009A773F3|nr:bifunctional DNA primase/polymerase [Mycobacteroides abscessus]SKE70398.1 Bifunctional DNA primase/polymerase, N-terminal [Mycobacteroides abscessus subsp. massiliense]SKH80743.1 Bifunctional DNA primase/polymerase, N-terminal [Mycobacteroides abscessus subsp. massiliense]SKI34311.1 Bifunctional DNA primase/polymerase, N-terminal [Mycobacteroides abscessus subsp. massiliense]SKJ36544.1 Bifunctional DNA primase/polymerase, N-terminal [Mycobacteroides abscessus subsp. massiliense]SKK23476.1 B
MSENAPIRMVHPDDAPVKVLLQYAGLSPADIPGESRIMTLAEVEAEVARRGITVSIPDPLPAPTREEADAFVFRMQRLGAHLLRLRPGSKKPVDEAWGDQPALTEAEAIEWLVAGGNLGVNLGRSNAIVLDPENAAATQFLMAAGLKPTVVTAKGEDTTSPKVGGRHVWIAVPEGVSADQLRSVLQIKLGEEGLIDVLAGSRFVVAPGSRLDEAPGYRYGFATGGALVDDGEWRMAPAWLFDATAAAPSIELEPLRGILAPRVRRERVPNPQSDAITEAVDRVAWAGWLAGDPRVTIIGVDSACGCEVFHWHASGEARSGVLHDECQFGSGVHVFSGTLIAEWGREHGSRLQFAAWLHGVSEAEIAKKFGIDLGGALPSFADQLDDAAETMEQRAADPAQCTGSVKRPDPDSVPQLVSLVDGVQTSRTSGEVVVPATADFWRGQAGSLRSLALLLRGGHHHAEGAVLIGADSVVGAPAPAQAQPAPEGEIVDVETVEESPAPPSTETAPAVDDAIQGEVVTEWEDGDQAMWERIREIEAKLRGERDPHTLLWTGMTPGLGRIANIAERDGVYYHGVIEPILARISARVPANVLIEPRNGNRENKISGLSLSYNVLTFGAPATAKTTSMATAESAVPFPPGIAVKPSGTAEGLVKAARRKVGGGHGRLPEQKIVATSVFACTDEIGTVKSELKRDASKYIYHVNSAYFGNSVLGQTASEDSRDVTIPPHGVRMSQLFGAQPQLCSELWEHAGSGFDARWAGVFAGSHAKEDLGPLFGKPVPALLPNGLPWDPPVGIPYGFSPAGVIEDEETGEKTLSYEADAPEDLPPVWIAMPKAAKEGAEEALARSADRSRHTRRAMLHDMEANRSEGHEGVRTRKAAALLAILDGLQHPEEVHWRAAELLCEASNLAIEESIAQSEMYRDHQAKKSGRTKGLEMASGRAAAEQATADAVAAAADAIYNKLTRPVEGTLVRGKIAKGFGGTATVAQITAAKVIGSRHSGYIQQGFDRLVNERRISVAAVGDDRRQWRVTAQGALTAAPPINGIAS